jgi:hypothetical protein
MSIPFSKQDDSRYSGIVDNFQPPAPEHRGRCRRAMKKNGKDDKLVKK